MFCLERCELDKEAAVYLGYDDMLRKLATPLSAVSSKSYSYQNTFLETIGRWAYSTDLGALGEPQSRIARLFTGALRATKHGEKAFSLASVIGPQAMMWLPTRAPKTLDHVASQIRQTCEELVVDRELKAQEKGLGEKTHHGLLDTLRTHCR